MERVGGGGEAEVGGRSILTAARGAGPAGARPPDPFAPPGGVDYAPPL